MAHYYENLYKTKPRRYHPYHSEVQNKMINNMENRDYEYTNYNQPPSINEIWEIIEEKKNQKSTPDIPNEMLKRAGEAMVNPFEWI